MMRHHHDCGSRLRQLPQDQTQFVLRSKIQRDERLIQDQCTRIMHKRPGQQHSACFARRHLVSKPFGEMQDFQHCHRTLGSSVHF